MAVTRKNSAWWIDYYYQGRRHRQKIGSRRKDAEEALARIKVKIAAGEFVPPQERQRQEALERQSVPFRDFAAGEYLPWSEVNHSPNHHRLQESIIRVHLLSLFGGRYLHEITTKYIEDYVAQRRRGNYQKGRRKRPVTPGTVNRDLACLKVLFRKAVEWGHLEVSPTDSVKMLKEIPNAPRLLESEEVTHLLEEMPDHQKALIATVVYAGLRREELFHLQWQDIDWKASELHVVSRQDHPTKNNESRTIPMNDLVVETLKRNPRHITSDLVLARDDGKAYKTMKGGFDAVLEKAGLPQIRIHDLRHSFASNLVIAGVPLNVVQELLWHKDINMTMIYAHLAPNAKEAAVALLASGGLDKGAEAARTGSSASA